MSPADQALDLFAVAPPGLEQLLAAELRKLGVRGSLTEGGIAWSGDIEQVRRVNLHARLATRVLVRLGEFRARSFIELERHLGRLPWARHLGDPPVHVRVSSRKSKLYHERAIAERVQRALGTEAVSGTSNGGEEVEGEVEGEAAQLFVVRVLRDLFTVSADSSGALLHRRGYRQRIGPAPLRETLAAALLQAGVYQEGEALLDPFCGSGTIPIEAALLARRVPPGLAGAERRPRAYAFERWPGHDAVAWEAEVARARDAILPEATAPIFASDRAASAVEDARANAARAGVEGDIRWTVAPLSRAPHPDAIGLVATNPPYGQRVSGQRELRDLFAALGAYLRRELPAWRVALLSPDVRLDAQLGVQLETAAATRNGGIGVRLLVSGAGGSGLDP